MKNPVAEAVTLAVIVFVLTLLLFGNDFDADRTLKQFKDTAVERKAGHYNADGEFIWGESYLEPIELNVRHSPDPRNTRLTGIDIVKMLNHYDRLSYVSKIDYKNELLASDTANRKMEIAATIAEAESTIDAAEETLNHFEALVYLFQKAQATDDAAMVEKYRKELDTAISKRQLQRELREAAIIIEKHEKATNSLD